MAGKLKKMASSPGQVLDHREVRHPRTILSGKIEEKRGPGRRQRSWLRNIEN